MSDFSNTPIVELAAIVAKHLQSQDIEVVLVGGLAVEIYTENLYLTKDIDMINTNYQSPDKMQASMAELGFHKKGRVYVHNTTEITIEFPPGPLAVGSQLIKTTEITTSKIGNTQIPILKIDDVIKDRLAAYIHWDDNQSLIQATAIILKHELNPVQFRDFCMQEGADSAYDFLQQLHDHAKEKHIESMKQLEVLLAQLLLRNL